jgi:hypothetical protein
MIAARRDRQGRRPTSGPPIGASLVATGCGGRFGAVMNLCDLAPSYSPSACQAAWRGDEATHHTHLADMKSAMGAALKAFNQLVSVGATASVA